MTIYTTLSFRCQIYVSTTWPYRLCSGDKAKTTFSVCRCAFGHINFIMWPLRKQVEKKRGVLAVT